MQRKIVVKADKLPASCEVINLKLGYTATIEVVDELVMVVKTGLAEDYVFGRHGYFFTKKVVKAGTPNAKEVRTQVTGVSMVRDLGCNQVILMEDGTYKVQERFGDAISLEQCAVEVDSKTKTIVFKVCKGVDMSKHSHVEATCYKTGDRVRLAFM